MMKYWISSDAKQKCLLSDSLIYYYLSMKFNIWNTIVNFDHNTYELNLNWKTIKPNIRTYGQMKNLYIENNNTLNDDEAMYLMYRWVYLCSEHKKLFEENDLRYDITIILPKIIWKEYNKTFGHYHPKSPNWIYYEEIYQVLYWNAIYLQQNNKETFYTNTKKGGSVLMKQGFWHVSINISDTDFLVMANIVSNKFSSIYNEYETKKGARYYLTTDWWVKNKNYNDDMELKKVDAYLSIKDLYGDFIKNYKNFIFLNW